MNYKCAYVLLVLFSDFFSFIIYILFFGTVFLGGRDMKRKSILLIAILAVIMALFVSCNPEVSGGGSTGGSGGSGSGPTTKLYFTLDANVEVADGCPRPSTVKDPSEFTYKYTISSSQTASTPVEGNGTIDFVNGVFVVNLALQPGEYEVTVKAFDGEKQKGVYTVDVELKDQTTTRVKVDAKVSIYKNDNGQLTVRNTISAATKFFGGLVEPDKVDPEKVNFLLGTITDARQYDDKVENAKWLDCFLMYKVFPITEALYENYKNIPNASRLDNKEIPYSMIAGTVKHGEGTLENGDSPKVIVKFEGEGEYYCIKFAIAHYDSRDGVYFGTYFGGYGELVFKNENGKAINLDLEVYDSYLSSTYRAGVEVLSPSGN